MNGTDSYITECADNGFTTRIARSTDSLNTTAKRRALRTYTGNDAVKCQCAGKGSSERSVLRKSAECGGAEKGSGSREGESYHCGSCEEPYVRNPAVTRV